MDIQFETTGCRLNQIESESAARAFIEQSFSVSMMPLTAASPVQNDAILGILNTCAVTQKAEQKDRRIIRLMLEKLPNATIIVTGCYAQLAKEYLLTMDKRIAVLPGQLKARLLDCAVFLRKKVNEFNYKNCNLPSNKSQNKNTASEGLNKIKFNPEDFAKILNETLFSKETKNPGTSENPFMLSTDSFVAHSRASIKIQDGCNCACTYCTIHIARGKSVSLKADEVIKRIIHLEESGQNEVVITTVNIGQYKSEYNGEKIGFTKLLSLCLEKTKSINFRISSLYPEIVDDYFCSVIKDKRVRPHFHLSVQSGSNEILKKMGRAYKAQTVIDACKKLKDAKENPFLSCDIITGFPGETDEDFNQTLELCKKSGFTAIHVFPFSERKGTAACSMKNKVPQSISRQRAKILSDFSLKNKSQYIEQCKGKVFDGIMEKIKTKTVLSQKNEEIIFHAITENFLHCQIKGFKSNLAPRPGQKISIQIEGPIPSLSAKGGELECIAKIV